MIETSIYTIEMARAWRKIDKPFPFTVDIAQDDDRLNVLWYQSEVDKWDDAQKFAAGEYLITVATLLESYGVQVNIQGVPGEPRRV